MAVRPASGIDLVLSLCRAVVSPAGDVEGLRSRLAGGIVSERTLVGLLSRPVAPEPERQTFLRAMRDLTGTLGGTHVPAVAGALSAVDDADLAEICVSYLRRAGAGHEAAVAALLAGADVDLSLALVRTLAAIGTPAARDAIGQAAKSRHAIVRIEALGHLEGLSSERLRVDLQAMIGDASPEVRMAALDLVTKHKIRSAGPVLALRARSRGFDALPLGERRGVLDALAGLMTSRAEQVAIALLEERALVSTSAHEGTRILAAELLGRIGSSMEAVEALEGACRRGGGTAAVREAAARARDLLGARRGTRKG